MRNWSRKLLFDIVTDVCVGLTLKHIVRKYNFSCSHTRVAAVLLEYNISYRSIRRSHKMGLSPEEIFKNCTRSDCVYRWGQWKPDEIYIALDLLRQNKKFDEINSAIPNHSYQGFQRFAQRRGTRIRELRKRLKSGTEIETIISEMGL